MLVFCDLHHADLYYSLQLLFEKRLGFEMYRPIGLEWHSEGFWNVYPHPATANQFLSLDQAIIPPKDVHGNNLPMKDQFNRYYRYEDGIYYIYDTTKNKIQRGITLDKFKSMNFDIIISSMPQHVEPFNRLISQFQPHAKHIFQVGNQWDMRLNVKNILASTSASVAPSNVNMVFYHQEFDLDVFRYQPPTVHKEVDSYIHYMKETELMSQFASLCSDWIFRTHGAGMSDAFNKTQDIATQMMNSAWTWHVKPGGDGYGHILHNSFACGRPLIIKKAYYRGQSAEPLLEDLVTCIDLSCRSTQESCSILQQVCDPEKHTRLCENTYNRFRDVVNFDEEEVKIRKFLENLQ